MNPTKNPTKHTAYTKKIGRFSDGNENGGRAQNDYLQGNK